jgi:hypothetical protein
MYILDLSKFDEIPTLLRFDPDYQNGPYRLSDDKRRFFDYVAQHYEHIEFEEDERLIVLRRRG